ncbi:hypothetical protein GCM10009745_75320 [Kribbella yunnanensis]|uniref:Uncharacterized protein n=1 Tax=Kribbella yunnanensis TaxID=190194 RepID=A0ABN2J1S5_9ACTN
MNEEDLNRALRDAMERSTPPPSMDPSQALNHGRTAFRRRRLAWTGLAVIPLVAAIGGGPALVANLGGGGSGGDLVAGGPTATAAPTTRKSGDPWPEGQSDRTATAGPRMTRVTKLMDDLSSSVPAGFTTPDLKAPEGHRLRYAQAQYASNDGEQDYWEYAATIPVERDGKVGKLLLNSTTPDGKPATDPCKLAKGFWGGTGTCAIVDVDGKKVGVVTTKGQGEFDQWATYRYDDGTVVMLAQAKKYEGQPKPLAQPIFTSRQLAELATAAKFKISD